MPSEASPSLPPGGPPPRATYRVQFNASFTFRDAAELVPYLAALGISDLYASPYFAASPESSHGYDVGDHNLLNPALGGAEDYQALGEALRSHQLGQILDFVPNHMGVGAFNRWWYDVLENGQSSLYAPYFDIEWLPPRATLRNRVLLPFLDDHYGKVLEEGRLRLDCVQGAFVLRVNDQALPVNPGTWPPLLFDTLALLPDGEPSATELATIAHLCSDLPPIDEMDAEGKRERARRVARIKELFTAALEKHPPLRDAVARTLERWNGKPGEPRSFDDLDALIEAQGYRLAWWRTSSEEINYRRFFDVDGLAAIHMEAPEVFAAAHGLVEKLLASGNVTGLRIDHVDGLWDPKSYLEQLRALHARVTEGKRGPLYLVVEKILIEDEPLPEDWPVEGTTGYEFAARSTALLVDSAAERRLTEIYRGFTGRRERLRDLRYEKKKLVMAISLSSSVHQLGSSLARLIERDRTVRDFPEQGLFVAVREIMACLPIYRTYRRPGQPLRPEDRRAIEAAVTEAKCRNELDGSFFDLVHAVLVGEYPGEGADEERRADLLQWVMRFQQCTGAVMAKGFEDTVFFLYNRLQALNEVGGDPSVFGLTPAAFHAWCDERARLWPHALLATSTHDTKLSEDARARLAVLSEIPDDWSRHLEAWRQINRHAKRDVDGAAAPDANEEYLFYQAVLATWPLEGLPDAEYRERLKRYLRKAVNEAKENSRWTQQNAAWLEACDTFVDGVLTPDDVSLFAAAFVPFARRVAQAGMVNSLAQTVLKLTAPGVPDVYQGNECWDFSLVDPDNRRPVDFARRRRLLESLPARSPEELLKTWRDGALKLAVVQRLLRARAEAPELFSHGGYRGLKVAGRWSECLLAFERAWNGERLVALVPRLTVRVGQPPVGEVWSDTTVLLGESAPARWRDLLTGRDVAVSGGELRLADALAVWPVAVLKPLAP